MSPPAVPSGRMRFEWRSKLDHRVPLDRGVYWIGPLKALDSADDFLNKMTETFMQADSFPTIAVRILGAWNIALALALIWQSPAWADGKFFARNAPLQVPYQRALIAFDGSRELLVVQSRFQQTDKAPLDEIGWLVPVPAVPKIGTMSPDATAAVFAKADRDTQLEDICISCWIGRVYVALLAAVALRLLIATFFGGSARWPRLIGTPAGNLVLLILAIPPVMILAVPVLALRALAAGFKITSSKWPGLVGTVGGNLRLLLYSLVTMCVLAIAIPQFSDYSGNRSVTVLREEVVSGLNIKVIQAQDSGALLGWLNEHNFRHDEDDQRVLEDYIRKGWVFVAAKREPSSIHQILGAEGMLVPLVLVFPTKQAVYPLALTATAGTRTWIDLFVFASQRVQVVAPPDQRRVRVLYAATKAEGIAWLTPYVDPKGLLDGIPFTENFVTRFQAILSPAEMERDLLFLPAGMNEYTANWH